jgi:hypothetical protein
MFSAKITVGHRIFPIALRKSNSKLKAKISALTKKELPGRGKGNEKTLVFQPLSKKPHRLTLASQRQPSLLHQKPTFDKINIQESIAFYLPTRNRLRKNLGKQFHLH